ncbi:uncharacterized protein LOC141915556 [Tubulanus polymorphus]|uniref:uncharacterized protein LOC141915556 n=1 Tax=Tubulanus polymorphus TaxID=672921 RepID=UPI003DA49E33
MMLVNIASFILFVKLVAGTNENQLPGTLRRFTDESGKVATEQVIVLPNGNREFIVIPKQSLSDRTTVYHNIEKGITLFKDHTYKKCFLAEIHPEVINTRFLMFKYGSDGSANGNVFEMETYGTPITNVEENIGDETVSGMCAGMLVFRVKPISKQSQRRKRDLSASASCTVSVDSKGRLSVSGSMGAGSKSSSAQSSGDAGKGGRSVSIGGSVSVGRGRSSARGSVSAGEKSSHSTSGSNGRTSSSSSSGRSSSNGGTSTRSSSSASDSRGSRGGGRGW